MNKTRLLIYCLQSLQGLFCGTQSLISYSKLFREMNSFISIWGRRCFQDDDTLCSQKVILKSPFYLEFDSSVACVKISVAISQGWSFFIWNISVARLRNVSMMHRGWHIFFYDFFIRWRFVIMKKSQNLLFFM